MSYCKGLEINTVLAKLVPVDQGSCLTSDSLGLIKDSALPGYHRLVIYNHGQHCQRAVVREVIC